MRLKSHQEYTLSISIAEQFRSQDKNRCKLHLMPPVGWLNDPNGLCQLNGTYHFFFQYSPFNARGGEKFWGHYESPDLIHWTYTGAPLSPDTAWDKDGVYSGCALVEDNKMLLYYTGNVKEDGDYDYIYEGRQANTLLVTTEDGIHMSHKHLLMSNKDYPQDLSCHIRDPKVWTEASADKRTYYMVQGARTKADKGVVILFKSPDGISWECENRLETPSNFGYMWECPDLFSLESKTILSLSPQGLEAKEHEFQNIYQSGYFVVNGDYHTDSYTLNDFREWDYGFDFYAPQTFLDESGRRILVGWVGMPDAEYSNPTVADGWQHLFTVPRVLTFDEDKVFQCPVPELATLRQAKSVFTTEKAHEFSYQSKSALEVICQSIPDSDFSMSIGDVLEIRYQKQEQIISLTFPEENFGRTCRSAHLQCLDQLSVLIDTSVVELYLNQGEIVFTTRYFSDLEMQKVTISTPDVSGVLYEMKDLSIQY